MDLHQLRVFHAAMRHGGFTRAGEELRLSQSTVSQHIQQLEKELGCPLFLRVGKRVVATDAGNTLFTHAERLFRDLKNAEIAVREVASSKRGTVRFGVGPTTLTYRLPPTLAAYKRRFPEIDLIVTATTTENLLEAMKAHKLDLAVVMQPVPPFLGLNITPLGREELVVVLPLHHELAARGVVEPADLASLPFILYGRSTAMQTLIERYFAALGIAPRVVMEVENNEAIKSLVSSGLGASILPLCAVEGRPNRVSIVRVTGPPLTRELALVTARSEVLPEAIREFRAALTEALSPEAGLRLAAR
jgi:LysR family transcriptional activator of glutamate synthase operon